MIPADELDGPVQSTSHDFILYISDLLEDDVSVLVTCFLGVMEIVEQP